MEKTEIIKIDSPNKKENLEKRLEAYRRFLSKIEEKNLTPYNVSKHTGIATSTLSDWKNGKSMPKPDKMKKIADYLDVDMGYLMVEIDSKTDHSVQDESKYLDFGKSTEFELSHDEMKLIRNFRKLDSYGKELLNLILNKELERIHAQLISKTKSRTSSRLIQYYQRLASAGTGQFVFDNLPTDMIEIPDITEYKKVKYAIGVNGRSMEPEYHDGDTLLIEPTNTVENGEIGIFISNGEAFIKKLGANELISLNKEFKNIPLTHDTRCVGRVIDKLNPMSTLSKDDFDMINSGVNFNDISSHAQNW